MGNRVVYSKMMKGLTKQNWGKRFGQENNSCCMQIARERW